MECAKRVHGINGKASKQTNNHNTPEVHLTLPYLSTNQTKKTYKLIAVRYFTLPYLTLPRGAAISKIFHSFQNLISISYLLPAPLPKSLSTTFRLTLHHNHNHHLFFPCGQPGLLPPAPFPFLPPKTTKRHRHRLPARRFQHPPPPQRKKRTCGK